MDFAKVSVEIRNQMGKGPARRARRSGKLPGVLYGHKVDPLSLILDPTELMHALDKERKRNTVFTLQVKGEAKAEDVTAMIRDVQVDPLSRQPVHVDFIRVSMDEEVTVTIPVVLTGTALGVVNGGNLHLSHHTLAIAAKPDAIPSKV
jgi:large subunit ribosomal protein L25